MKIVTKNIYALICYFCIISFMTISAHAQNTEDNPYPWRIITQIPEPEVIMMRNNIVAPEDTGHSSIMCCLLSMCAIGTLSFGAAAHSIILILGGIMECGCATMYCTHSVERTCTNGR